MHPCNRLRAEVLLAVELTTLKMQLHESRHVRRSGADRPRRSEGNELKPALLEAVVGRNVALRDRLTQFAIRRLDSYSFRAARTPPRECGWRNRSLQSRWLHTLLARLRNLSTW
jgi:hypothetical protein